MPPIQKFINLVADESNLLGDSAAMNEIIKQYYELWKASEDPMIVSMCVEALYAEL